MRGTRRGVTACRRVRPALAALTAAASLGGLAHAAENADTESEAREVSAIQVTGQRTPLDESVELPGVSTTVQDLPQAVSVIDAAQLKSQGIASLEQALRNVPGITIAIGEGGTLNGDQFKIRGFDAKDDVYIDSLRDF